MQQRTPRPRDLLLDAWRGVSVLLVIFNHVVGNQVLSSAPVGEKFNLFDCYVGQLGVQFFFVISGYIITTLLVREYGKNGRVSLGAFYLRRAFRILPPMCLVLAVTALFVALGYIAVTQKAFLLGAFFLCDVRYHECNWFTGHLWSLAVEEQFYLVWPLLLCLLGFRRIAAVALTLAMFFLVIAQILGSQFPLTPDIAVSFACIAVGCLYATSPKLRGLVEQHANAAMVLIVALILFAKPIIPLVAPGQYRLQEFVQPWLICFVLFSSFRYRALLEQRLWVKALANLGIISYGVYLWQEMFLGERAKYLHPSLLGWTPAFLVLALLSYTLVEKPLMRVGAQLSHKLLNRTLQTPPAHAKTLVKQA